jgi:hypothetical protein
MAKHEDKIPGGLADKKQPKDFDKKKLAEGSKVELEHAKDKSIAIEIAMDHLSEDKDYYKKLKEVEKQDLIEVTPDGKQEPVPGVEPLKKDPKARWKKLKKALNNLDSIMNLKEEAGFNEAEEKMQEQQTQPEEVQQQPEDQQEPVEQTAEDQVADMSQEEQPQEEQMDDTASQEGENPASDEEIAQAMKEEGYSDAEIAHVVHGHHFQEIDETAQAKADATRAMSDIEVDNAKLHGAHELEHKKRMSDLEFEQARANAPDPQLEKEHKKRMLDLEFQRAKAEADSINPELDKEHRKRMLDLEFEITRQQKAIELEYKRKEMELKLKHAEEAAKKKMDAVGKKSEKSDD